MPGNQRAPPDPPPSASTFCRYPSLACRTLISFTADYSCGSLGMVVVVVGEHPDALRLLSTFDFDIRGSVVAEKQSGLRAAAVLARG